MSRFGRSFVLLTSIALVAFTIECVRHLQLRSSFQELLPAHYRSVIELKKIEARVGPEGYLMIAAESEHWPELKRFLDDLTDRMRRDYPDRIQEIHQHKQELKNFFDKNKYLYIDLPDLKKIHRRLKERIAVEKLKGSGLFFDLDEEPEFTLEDIWSKYSRFTDRFQNYREGYFTNKEGTLAVLLLKPKSSTTATDFIETLMQDLTLTIKSLHPENYAADIQYGFAGRFRNLVVEYQSVIGDILKTSLLCIALVALVVLAYFRNIRMGALMAANVACGTLITLTLAYFTIGYLTSQSAFLGSIIVGNGINYSLILMSRYLEERLDRNHLPATAIDIAMRQTWKPTLAAATTASASFAVLGLTHIKGFSQFGLIGGAGMLICWLSTYLLLPSWLLASEQLKPIKKKDVGPRNWKYSLRFGRRIVQYARPILVIGVVATVAAAVMTIAYIPRSLEYDFSKLRFKSSKSQDWESRVQDRVGDIFGHAITPTVIIAPDPNTADQVCDVILAKDKEASAEPAAPGRARGLLGGKSSSASESFPLTMVDRCQTYHRLAPKNQSEKLRVIGKIRELLDPRTTKFLNAEQQTEMNHLLATRDLKEISFRDLPDDLTGSFREQDGTLGRLVYVYPKPDANLWQGQNLVRFANLVREVHLKDGRVIYASGEPVIFADLLQAVVTEGPKVTLYSLVAVMLIVVLTFRRWKDTAIILGSLMTGVLGMIGFMGFTHIKLNFLNFIALPTTFGIGVDYIVNMYQRYRQEPDMKVEELVAKSGRAVFICSLTTIIGYSVLMTSKNQGLVSFGWVGVIGEITCLVSATVLFPAWLAAGRR